MTSIPGYDNCTAPEPFTPVIISSNPGIPTVLPWESATCPITQYRLWKSQNGILNIINLDAPNVFQIEINHTDPNITLKG